MGDSGGHAAAARILVVDDDASIRFLCRINLELDGYEVVEADTLEAARDSLAAGDVAAVLLDVHLHGERSDELLVECHALEPPIPVIVVTGSADVTQERLGAADAVLPKPFELDALLSTVRRLAQEHARR
jgi:DNA-binding NtrC family response regulator